MSSVYVRGWSGFVSMCGGGWGRRVGVSVIGCDFISYRRLPVVVKWFVFHTCTNLLIQSSAGQWNVVASSDARVVTASNRQVTVLRLMFRAQLDIVRAIIT